jgi:DNA helicase-2/ATP-dependent DNA helicase PcrA
MEKLNREQRRAVTAPIEGYNLIIASAGTGKTSTIVARISYLLHHGVKPEEILLLTFTNKAGEEMKQRLISQTPLGSRVEAGTFHAVSYRWLKKMKREMVIKSPKDMKLLLKSIYDRRELHRLQEETPPFSSAYLYDLHSLFLNSGGEEFGEWLLEKYPEHEPFIDAYLDILDEFEEVKREHHLIDFNTLLLEMINYLKEGGKLPFRHILVDEYQDTNPLQSQLIDLMEQGSLFCVGDYDQSIYGFNGADISIIGTFKERYPFARVFTLKKNYRSYGEILEVANRVIRLNPRLYPKELEVTRGYKGEYPRWLRYIDTYHQYQDIARRIAHSSTPRSEIAILFRNNSSGDAIEGFLRQEGVSVRRRGGISFFESREIKLTLDILTFTINSRDIMAFIHLVQYAKGIGSGVAKELFSGLMKLGHGNPKKGLLSPDWGVDPFGKPRTSTQLGLFGHPAERGNFPGASRHPIFRHPRLKPEGAEFLNQLAEFLRNLEKLSTKTPEGVIGELLKAPFFTQSLKEIATSRSRERDGRVNPKKLEENFQKTRQRVQLLRQLGKGYNSIEKFLNSMILGGGEISQGKGVNLMTIHASKGLEFKEVYLIDLMEGRFPNLRLAGGEEGIEEERRLFYVAVTRAKDTLYFCSASFDPTKRKEVAPSRFLKEAGYFSQTKKELQPKGIVL